MNPRYLTPQHDQIWLLTNPRAGARAAEQTVEEFEERVGSAGFHSTRFTSPDELRDAMNGGDIGRLRAVVAAGGDGTANLVAQLIPATVPFIPLPLGTENLLAKYLALSGGPERVAEAVAHGRVEAFDAGLCNGQLFLLMVGAGFDAEVVQRLHAARTGHIHHLSYAAPIFRTIWEYPYPLLRVKYRTPSDDWQEAHGRWVFVINLPRYARGLSFVPDASGQDGYLDLCVFKSGSLWAGLYYLANVVMGQHQRLDDCLITRITCAEIEVADASSASVAYQYDGDPGGTLPAKIQVLPARCSIIVPRDWDAAKPLNEAENESSGKSGREETEPAN